MPKSLYFPGAYAGRDEYRNYEYLAEVTEYLSLLFLGLHCPIHPPHIENRRNTDRYQTTLGFSHVSSDGIHT